MGNKYKNYGVILGRRDTDYEAGLVAGNLPYEERNPSGDWRSYLPPGEWQKSDNGDSQSCVSFGHINSIEMQEKLHTGKQTNWADRWIAKRSETTRVGNYLYKVADQIRSDGLVEESDYPAPKTYTWDEYHAEIPEPLKSQLIMKGRAWLEKWDVKYEWVDISKESMKKHLKHAPLSVVIPGHMVVDVFCEEDIDKIFDSYAPFLKDVPGAEYPSKITHAMKVVLTPKNNTDPDLLLANIEYGEFGTKVTKLLKALRRLGWGYPESENWGDLYDDQVKDLVFRYQLGNLNRYGWSWWWTLFFYRGRIVDATTRENINNNLLKRK